jgi:hypothetical protein
MSQNLITFFKDSCPLSIVSIATSNTSDVHLPHCVNLGTLLTLADFSTCVRNAGEMFSLFVHCWFRKLLRLLRGTMDIMVLIPAS